MSTLVLTLQGRAGNQAMQYLFARGFALARNMELRTDPWIGERIFDISHPRPEPGVKFRMNEIELIANHAQLPIIEFRGYAQMQRCADYYTKRQAQEWLKLRPEIESACAAAVAADGGANDRIVYHLRHGDYFGYGYPVVSQASYRQSALDFGLDWNAADRIALLSEEDPTPHAGFLPDDLSFMPDFYRMMKAPTLLRANSSFSWLAALLGNGLVLSPVIDGLEGGKEHHCRFIAGNAPKFANLDFVENLNVAP